jgi:uncharacterized phage protein gp47/JayE
MPLSTLSVTILPTGISAPTYEAILTSMTETFQQIYGADVYLEPDSQDGQLLAIVCKAIDDANKNAIAVYNSFSPTFAQGAALSSVVKINGISRQVPSNSTAVGNVVGVVGTVITNGLVEDDNGVVWSLPISVTIPVAGTISVTVTCTEAGAILAPTGTISRINTPTLGWQSFTSTADASPGDPVETDAALRRRQAASTEISAITPAGSLYSALANLDGVERVQVYENPTGSVDADGLPAHSISVVISGGDVADVAEIIALKKTLGAATYGTTTENYTDPTTGTVSAINFFELDLITVEVEITGTALAGYSTLIAEEIKESVAAYLNSLSIGQDVQFSRINMPAYLNGSIDGNTYEITGITINKSGDPPGTIDLVIDFNEAASCVAASDVTVTIS